MKKTLPIDAWTRGGGTSFGTCTDLDEELHPTGSGDGVDSLTETWAYMFYDPENRISALVNVWVHPILGIVSGGIAIWQGLKSHYLQSELVNSTVFARMSECIQKNGRDIRFPSGLRIETRKSFEYIHIEYQDLPRHNQVNVTFKAASPPIMRESNKHFDQMVDVKGTIVLRGRHFSIDGYGCRDRSWGEPRPEDPYPIPPYTWMNGRFPSGMMWNGTAHDDPAGNPDWLSTFNVKSEDVFKDGWIYRDGEMTRLKSFSKTTTRDPLSARPVSHTIKMTDMGNRPYTIQGEVIACIPWNGWYNMVCWICCTRWEWNGEIGYGDTQEIQWTDFVLKHRLDQG